MGRKNGAVSASEPVAEQQTDNNNTQLESSKKKNKKSKHNLQNEEDTPKRKHEELNIQNDTESEKKSKKKKKHNKSKDNGEENGTGNGDSGVNGAETVSASDEPIVVTGKNAGDEKYAAVKTFVGSGLPDNVLECCKGFEKPSPIQSRAWPFLLDGRDLIGIAATGSGKTLAFGLPAIMHVLNKRKSKGSSKGRNPLCLMLSPTRELAQQIFDVLCDAGKSCGVESVCLYGGTSKGPQIAALKSGIDIVIGTPGRIQDLIEMGICRLQEVSFVVLDEADRMLDMGFEQIVRSILGQTGSVRQMVMFSATWPLAVHQLAQEFMDPNPVKVVVGSEDLSANHDVMQIVEVLDERSRDKRLLALLEKYHKSKKNRVLVFVLYKMETTRVERMLQQGGWKAVSISGDKSQHERTKALSLFKEGTCPLLIATDVAARGLDIPDVEVVINYSFPLTLEDYVHRIGRTGRAGKKGVAHTFFTHLNKGLAGELVNVLREAGQVVPDDLLKFGTHVKKKESKLYGSHFKEIAVDAPKSKKTTFDSDDED
ncbi:DEAD-box ATP-dependent RNA helicase 5 [Vicia villosa]|uniref:DEAD-box ATP-dependent RNA helicase 5 n=1 Tax=Vicia villosa TaxID=3911 RepID=UPI00273C8F56|nr:DEAD-box ATP-dependent RNA helicase 5 [Vicia villosa]